MNTFSRFTLALALPLLVALSTCKLVDDEVVQACSDYCTAFEQCGMFPSFLGAGDYRSSREDCVARCVLSSEVRDQVASCIEQSHALESVLAQDVKAWCSLGACDRLAECLTAEIDEQVAGVGIVDTKICRTPNPVARVPLSEVFELEQCIDGCGTDETHCACDDDFLSSDDIAEVCGEWNVHVSTEATKDLDISELPSVRVDIGKVSLELHSLSKSIVVASDLCEDVLAQSHEADDVPLALYRTQLVLETEGGGCYAIPGEQFLVTAGVELTAVWLLPDSLEGVVAVECEIGPDKCEDGIDNDRDGLSDCNDWHCRSYCEICDDDVDNDSDALIDCEDTDCTADPACTTDTTTDSTDTTSSGDSTDSTDSSDSTDSGSTDSGSTDSTT